MVDCPGIVYPSGDTETEVVLKGVVRVENLKEPSDHIEEVLRRVKHEYITKTYKISSWDNSEDFLEQMCKKSGRLLKVCVLFVIKKCVVIYIITKTRPKC